MKEVSMEIFNYKQEARAFRKRQLQRIADYAYQRKEVTIPCLAKLFRAGRGTIDKALASGGVRRGSGRKTWHFPSKEGTGTTTASSEAK
jgi:hypothetical protein